MPDPENPISSAFDPEAVVERFALRLEAELKDPLNTWLTPEAKAYFLASGYPLSMFERRSRIILLEEMMRDLAAIVVIAINDTVNTAIDGLTSGTVAFRLTVIKFTGTTAANTVIDCTTSGATWTQSGTIPDLGIDAIVFNNSMLIQVKNNGSVPCDKPGEVAWISPTSIQLKRIYYADETLLIES